MMINKRFINWILGLLYALAIVAGFEASCFGALRLDSVWTYFFTILITVIASLFFKTVWEYIYSRPRRKVMPVSDTGKNKPFLYFAIIWIAYFIVFLGVYPGFFCYDAQYELTETVARSFDNQHPLLHVLSMGGIIQAVHKITGDYNISIAAFILFQMTVIALVLTFLVYFLTRLSLTKKEGIILSIYFGVFPVLAMYALCSSKDGMFGAFLILTIIYLRRLYTAPDTFFEDKKNSVILIVSLILMMLMRNNGVYAFAVYLVFIALWLFIGKYFKKIDKTVFKKALVLFALAVVIFAAADKGMKAATHAKSVGHREILTVPIQQLARVYSYDKESLSTKEKEEILRYLPEEALRSYIPKCSDMVKIGFNEEEFLKDKKGFFDIYFKLLSKHPATYLNAWVMTSYGLYYPAAVIDGYKGAQMFTFVYGDSSYFGYEVEEPGSRHSLIPFIDSFYKWLSLDVTIQKIPIVSLLFSPGFLLWIMLFLLGYLIYTKQVALSITYLLPIAVMLTSMIGPMSLVRYSYFLWITVPMLAVEIINLKRNDNEKDS